MTREIKAALIAFSLLLASSSSSRLAEQQEAKPEPPKKQVHINLGSFGKNAQDMAFQFGAAFANTNDACPQFGGYFAVTPHSFQLIFRHYDSDIQTSVETDEKQHRVLFVRKTCKLEMLISRTEAVDEVDDGKPQVAVKPISEPDKVREGRPKMSAVREKLNAARRAKMPPVPYTDQINLEFDSLTNPCTPTNGSFTVSQAGISFITTMRFMKTGSGGRANDSVKANKQRRVAWVDSKCSTEMLVSMYELKDAVWMKVDPMTPENYYETIPPMLKVPRGK